MNKFVEAISTFEVSGLPVPVLERLYQIVFWHWELKRPFGSFYHLQSSNIAVQSAMDLAYRICYGQTRGSSREMKALQIPWWMTVGIRESESGIEVRHKMMEVVLLMVVLNE